MPQRYNNSIKPLHQHVGAKVNGIMFYLTFLTGKHRIVTTKRRISRAEFLVITVLYVCRAIVQTGRGEEMPIP
jgi:hypothetical protein